jgi:hypothetical protein
MARRCFGRDLGDRLVEGNCDPADRVFTMQPQRWRTVDYAKLDALG